MGLGLLFDEWETVIYKRPMPGEASFKMPHGVNWVFNAWELGILVIGTFQKPRII